MNNTPPRYVPLKHFKGVHEDDSRIKVITGGIGTGTSSVLANEALALVRRKLDVLVLIESTKDPFIQTLYEWGADMLPNPKLTYTARTGYFDHPHKYTQYDVVVLPAAHNSAEIQNVVNCSDECAVDRYQKLLFDVKSMQTSTHKEMTVFSAPAVMVPDGEGGQKVNPELDVSHMPRGARWFEGTHKRLNNLH